MNDDPLLELEDIYQSRVFPKMTISIPMPKGVVLPRTRNQGIFSSEGLAPMPLPMDAPGTGSDRD
jgi:hypothetical protein